MANEYSKPLPEITDDNRPFVEGCKRHELLFQKCVDCGHLRHISPACPRCLSAEHEWVPASGKGKVYTWIVVHQRYSQAFEDDLPYNVTIVELEEGPRMLTSLVGVDNEDIRSGLSVEVVWDDVAAEITLPRFTPAG